MKRLVYIDIAKVIAIMLVILGHVYSCSSNPNSAVLNVIGSIHNPLFYLSAGVLLRQNFNSLSYNDKRSFLVLKAKRLLFPFCVWTFIYTLMQMVLFRSNVKESLFDVVNKLWFLPVLFIATVFVYIIYNYKLPIQIILVIGSVLLISSCYISTMIAKIITYMMIVYLGFHLKNMKRWIGIVSLILWIGIIVIFFCSGKIVLEDNFEIGTKLLIIMFAAIWGSLGLMHVIIVLSYKKVLFRNAWATISGATLYFYILHYIVIYYLEYTNLQIWKFNWLAVILAVVIPFMLYKIIYGTILDKLLFRPDLQIKRKIFNLCNKDKQ
ncbi:MAG: acyltransferase family protein [Lachnospiraceae bacterium]